jgi:hypothetical protein
MEWRDKSVYVPVIGIVALIVIIAAYYFWGM